MIFLIQRNITRFIILFLFQVFVFNNISFAGVLTPFIYILFILLMPFETPKWFFIIAGFILGLGVDMFENSLGVHAASTTLIGFMRPMVLRYVSPREGYETNSFPRVYYYGLTWFIKYAGILVFCHHFLYFLLSTFSFQDFHYTLFRIILNSAFTLFLISISQYLVFRK